jgi:hypothetical protein
MLSISESTSDASMLIDPVQSHAKSFAAIRISAVRTEAYVARRSCVS